MIISHVIEENNEETKRKEISEEENVISLSKRDLVILYANVDNTKQTDLKNRPDRKTPNQHVETVVYNEDLESEDSDVGEIYCNQDLYDVVLINKERLDILNSMPSLDKTLCQKLGDYNIETDHSIDYNGEFLYKNHFIQEQLNSVSNVSNFDTSFGGTFLSTSLLDYIFSNRFDDNCNYYMDNVIQFVNRTIDQLKRISNGDYLTDKAKEKWKRLESERKNDQVNKIAKVVVKTKSNPLHMECNITGLKNTWRDLVYSELDIRALSKIISKKIVVEIPRLIHGSYKLFSKGSDNNLIICCKKIFQKSKSEVDKKSRIDILVQLKRSNSQNVKADIDSVTILQKVLPRNESWYPLQYNYLESTKNVDNTMRNKVNIIELNEHEVEHDICSLENDTSSAVSKIHIKHENEETVNTENSVICISEISSQVSDQISNYCNKIIKHTDNEEKERDTQSLISDIVSSSVDDLFCSIQKLNTHTTLLEENEDFPSIRNKSPTKIRIKSPYENKSFFIEERKRKKLLEIRERRERRKKAHSENCKGKKYKYGKGAVMAQPSNSVTKLSITNKSFYNSIYGENANINKKYIKKHSQKGPSEILSESSVEKPITEYATLKVDHDFLNDGEKDQYNKIKDYSISSATAKNNDFSIDFNSFLDVPSATNLSPTNISINKEKHNESFMSVRMHNTTPASIINSNDSAKSFTNKSLISLECKKSIDKIYELIKKLSKVDSSDSSSSKCELSLTNENNLHPLKGKSLTLQISDSGTSLKHQLTSSNPSIYSFKATNNTAEVPTLKNVSIKTTRAEANVIPKVVISSKSHIQKLDKNASKSVKKVTINTPENISKNPLKVISHLINEFDHIQKNKQGAIIEVIENKKTSNGVIDGKTLTRHKKVSHYENQTKVVSNKIFIPNDRKTQSKLSVNRGKIINQQIAIDDKYIEKRDKITDIVDEALREARGEAVRGPSKLTRLDSLSRPKRLNINSQNEGVKLRHGKNTVPDKLSHVKFAAPQISEKPAVSTPICIKLRQKRNEQENVTVLNYKSPHNLTTTEKPTRQKRTINNFPFDNAIPPINTPSNKQRNVPENSRPFKKAMPVESLHLKKHNRQISLTQTAASSNLLQKPHKSHTIPAPNYSQQSKDPTLGISSPLVSQEPTEIKLSVRNELAAPLMVHNASIKTPTLFKEATNYIMSKNLFKDDELVSICSDYDVVDILEDKDVLTAVSSVTTQNKRSEQITKEIQGNEKLLSKTINPEHDTISNGIKHLEKALYRQMSEGVFQKRLKIKNLTLTPKPSMHQVFFLQCGDANSLLVKSCMAQNPNSRKHDMLCDKVQLSKISKSYLDWSNPKIPINFATIGYSFPKFKSIKCGSNTQIKFINNEKSGFQLTNEELKNSNDEKGVQTLQLDKSSIHIDAAFSTADLTNITETIVHSCTDSSEPLINTKRNSQFENTKATNESENVTNSTSLDILAELLDEIEKIAKYQSLKANDEDKTETKQSYNLSADPNCYVPHKFTEFCLNRNCITSKNQSNTLESEVIRKFNDNDVTQKIVKIANIIEPKYVDKEVTVTIYNECINAFTDVPSQLSIPKEEHRKASKSFTDTISEPSYHSLVSLYDYRTLYLNKMKDMPYIQSFNQPKQSDDSMENYDQFANRKGNEDSVYHRNQKDFNSMLRIKRDILVTIYSILVFTVFAALSLSEFIY